MEIANMKQKLSDALIRDIVNELQSTWTRIITTLDAENLRPVVESLQFRVLAEDVTRILSAYFDNYQPGTIDIVASAVRQEGGSYDTTDVDYYYMHERLEPDLTEWQTAPDDKGEGDGTDLPILLDIFGEMIAQGTPYPVIHRPDYDPNDQHEPADDSDAEADITAEDAAFEGLNDEPAEATDEEPVGSDH